jgi:uroporphyrinogen-III synthase
MIVITSPKNQAKTWADKWRTIMNQCGIPYIDSLKWVNQPALALEPITFSSSELAHHLKCLQRCSVLLFVSPSAIQLFSELVHTLPISSTNNFLHIGVMGQSSANTVRESQWLQGLDAANYSIWQPTLLTKDDREDSATLLKTMSQSLDWREHQVMLVQGQQGRLNLAARLEDQGATVFPWSIYERRSLPWSDAWQQQLCNALANASPIHLLFTSSEGVMAWQTEMQHHLNAKECQQLYQANCWVIHPRIAECAQIAGWQQIHLFDVTYNSTPPLTI